ncbi:MULTISPECIES: pitrilysin family protein [unclassified Kitasatospora]|uniref:M16 family metallopeptidase n=1 Tax=unclassified Kitasatospora TaxID=2633591 RepID=UPI001AE00CA8|nr:pitrilysin family protein [Kitasatospora sp. RG8]MBP0451127.1 insulinase family protein [Kitasatospora sp. RG8]
MPQAVESIRLHGHPVSDRLTVLSRPDERLRTTSFCLAVGFGARHDPEGANGAAHLLEHLLMTAPASGAVSVSEYIERRGGESNAITGLEAMVFEARVLTEDAPAVLERLLGAIAEPALTPSLLESERRVVLQELASAAADPSDVVQDAFLARIFAGHPLGRPVGGTVEELDRIDPEGLAAIHHDNFLRRGMALVSVGGLSAATVESVVRSSPLVASTAGPLPERGADRPLPALRRDLDVSWPEDDFCWLALGGRSAAGTAPQRHAFSVLAQLLGSSPSSRLYRALRGDAALAYAFASWSRSYQEAGAWRVLVGTEPRNGPQVVAVVVGLLEQLAADGPVEADLDAARKQAVMRLTLQTEDPLENARLLAQRGLDRSAPLSTDEETAALRSVTADDIRRSAADLLAELNLVVRPEAAR